MAPQSSKIFDVCFVLTRKFLKLFTKFINGKISQQEFVDKTESYALKQQKGYMYIVTRGISLGRGEM